MLLDLENATIQIPEPELEMYFYALSLQHGHNSSFDMADNVRTIMGSWIADFKVQFNLPTIYII